MMDLLKNSGMMVVLLGALKAVAVCMFALNVGVILTWVERRVRGMIQDCIGPNRAGIPVPGKIAAVALALGPGLTAALGVAGLALFLDSRAESNSLWGLMFLQGGVFLTWFAFAAIARSVGKSGASNPVEKEIASLGSPRSIALGGIAIQFAIALFGLTPLYAGRLVDFVFAGGATLLAGMLAAGSLHVAAQYFQQKTVRVTLLGLLHPAADGVKTAFKADFIPPKGDQLLYNLAPWITLLPSLVLLAVVPFGPTLCFDATEAGSPDFFGFQGLEAAGQRCPDARFSMMVADLDVGILYFFAMAGTGIVGAALAGWASDNKFSLLGGMRAASQMVSYEVTLGLTVVGALMIYGTVRIDEMILWQAENAWGIFVQPLAFFLFIAAAIAETKRVPFDLPEGESEIVAGYFTEYAGMKFAMFFFSEFIAVVSSSTLMVALFFGGWHLPFVTGTGIDVALGDVSYYSVSISPRLIAVMGVLAFIGKILSLCLLQVVIRWTLPRFRYDQLMRLGWRKLLPASLFNVLATAIVWLLIDSSSVGVKDTFVWLGQLSMVLLALVGLGIKLGLLVFLFVPNEKQRLVVSSAARYAELMGGTREAKMEA